MTINGKRPENADAASASIHEPCGLSTLEWARERWANSARIAGTKTGADRDSWLEDVKYWRAIVAALESAPPQKVWILTEETNTGDSEHDTMIVGVFGSPEAATRGLNAAVASAQAGGKVVLGEEDADDDGEWDRDFDVEAHEVKS